MPGAIVVGVIVAGAALGIFRTCSAETRPLWVWVSASVAFVVPAVLAGFLATNGVAKLVAPSEIWQAAFSVAGALIVGAAALTKIGAFRPGVHFVRAAMSRHGSR